MPGCRFWDPRLALPQRISASSATCLDQVPVFFGLGSAPEVLSESALRTGRDTAGPSLRSVEKHFQGGPWVGKENCQIPRLPPDFLSGLLVSVNLMRHSLEKAAYVVVLRAA
jgi:hypothetical protein